MSSRRRSQINPAPPGNKSWLGVCQWNCLADQRSTGNSTCLNHCSIERSRCISPIKSSKLVGTHSLGLEAANRFISTVRQKLVKDTTSVSVRVRVPLICCTSAYEFKLAPADFSIIVQFPVKNNRELFNLNQQFTSYAARKGQSRSTMHTGELESSFPRELTILSCLQRPWKSRDRWVFHCELLKFNKPLSAQVMLVTKIPNRSPPASVTVEASQIRNVNDSPG